MRYACSPSELAEGLPARRNGVPVKPRTKNRSAAFRRGIVRRGEEMTRLLPRALLALSAVILLAGAVLHTRAFPQTASAASASDLAPFYAGSLQALWLIDSAVLLAVAAILGLVAVRPRAASRPVLVLLSIIPGATAFFLYRFLGNFVPAHLLLAAALAALIGAFTSLQADNDSATWR